MSRESRQESRHRQESRESRHKQSRQERERRPSSEEVEGCWAEGAGRGWAGNKEAGPGGQQHLHSEGHRGEGRSGLRSEIHIDKLLTNILVGSIPIYFRKPRKLTNLTWRVNA